MTSVFDMVDMTPLPTLIRDLEKAARIPSFMLQSARLGRPPRRV